jgi:hypothetical protein
MNAIKKFLASFLSNKDVQDIVLFLYIVSFSEQTIPDLFELASVMDLYEFSLIEKVFHNNNGAVRNFVKNLERYEIHKFTDIMNTLPKIFQDCALERILTIFNAVEMQIYLENIPPILVMHPDKSLCVGYIESDNDIKIVC